MALLSIIVRQAQYSGDKSTTSQYCTYVTLTLDRCRTTTVAAKGHNPHWEQDYLFETQNTSRGLLIEVWKQDEYLHTPIGCYWLPLNMVRYSNEHTTGLWASLGSELYIEDGVIVKSVNATGHFLLYDARFEDPDDRRVSEHATVENENVEEYYPSTTSRRVNESVSNKSTPASISAEPSDEWYRYDNYQDGYRSSSSENVRSDLDYSYSETSNHMERRSCYESSEKSLEKEQYSHDDRNEQYYGDYEQSESYKASNSYGKRSNYENQIDDADEQWVSDEYAEEQADGEVYQNSHHDYGPSDGEYSFSYHHQSSHLKGAENDTKMYNHDGSYEDDELEEDDVDDEVDDEPDDSRYYENSYVYVQSPPTNKRILPSIPSFDSPTTPSLKKPPSTSMSMQNYHKNNYYYDQYKEKNGDNYTPRVPSIYIDSPTLSPCLSASKSTSFDYRDQHSDDSASIYQYSDNSMTAQRNEKTYCKTNSIHRYRRTNETSDNNFTRINADDYCSNEDAEEYGDYVNDEGTYSNDYYDYEDDYVAPAGKPDDRGSEIQDRNDDDINNNQLNSRRSSARSYVKKLCSSPFEKEEVTVPETYDATRKESLSRGKTSPLTRQSNSFTEQFEWTYNEIPEDDYDAYETAAQPILHQEPEPVSTSILNGFTKPTFYNNPIDSILEEDYNEDDDVTLVSPVNSSSLSPRSMNYLSQEKDHDTQETYDKENSLESYHEDLGKTSPTSEIDQFNDSSMADHTVDSYHSSYPPHKSSIGETNSLPIDTNSLIENENEDDNFVMDKLEIVPPEPRKSSLQKEENTAEMRRMRARNRWHNAYNKIIHQLNVSISQVGCKYAIILRNFIEVCVFLDPIFFYQSPFGFGIQEFQILELLVWVSGVEPNEGSEEAVAPSK